MADAGEITMDWQNKVRDLFLDAGVPPGVIDGGGCDSGCHFDFTASEIAPGISWFVDRFDETEQAQRQACADQWHELLDTCEFQHWSWDTMLIALKAIAAEWGETGTGQELVRRDEVARRLKKLCAELFNYQGCCETDSLNYNAYGAAVTMIRKLAQHYAPTAPGQEGGE